MVDDLSTNSKLPEGRCLIPCRGSNQDQSTQLTYDLTSKEEEEKEEEKNALILDLSKIYHPMENVIFKARTVHFNQLVQ